MRLKPFRIALVGIAGLVPFALGPEPRAAAEERVIRAGTVFTLAGEPLRPGALRIADGEIVEVAERIAAPAGAEVIDLGPNGALMPGLVDADFPGGLEGPSAEYSREVTPRFRPLPALDRDSRAFVEARAEGTTTAAILPGSDNVISGLAGVVKTSEALPVLEDATALVITMAEDPARRNRARTRPDSIYVRQPTNRMGVVWILRSTMTRVAAGEPLTDRLGLGRSSAVGATLADPIREAIAGRLPVFARSRTDHDILTTLRLAEEFGFSPVIVEGHEAYKIAERLGSADVPVILGTLTTSGLRGPEGTELAWNVAGLLQDAGVTIALSGGALLDQARFAVRFGLPNDQALRAVTATPAELLGVDDRVGTLEAGKAADVLAFSGDPLDLTSALRWVMIDGDLVFEDAESESDDASDADSASDSD